MLCETRDSASGLHERGMREGYAAGRKKVWRAWRENRVADPATHPFDIRDACSAAVAPHRRNGRRQGMRDRRLLTYASTVGACTGAMPDVTSNRAHRLRRPRRRTSGPRPPVVVSRRAPPHPSVPHRAARSPSRAVALRRPTGPEASRPEGSRADAASRRHVAPASARGVPSGGRVAPVPHPRRALLIRGRRAASPTSVPSPVARDPRRTSSSTAAAAGGVARAVRVRRALMPSSNENLRRQLLRA